VSVFFHKWQALGNDFIIIEGFLNPHLIKHISKLCSRKWGIGADGLIFLDQTSELSKITFFNQDGSCVKMCGNGLRCVMYHLHETHKPMVAEFSGATYRGFIEEGRIYITMPRPVEKSLQEAPYEGVWVEAGVPHFLIEKPKCHLGVLTKEHFENRYHKSFGSEGTNLTFYEKIGSQFFIRTCERGVDEETLACGSAACAIAYLTDDSDFEVIYPSKEKAYVKNTKEIFALSGEAEYIFSGNLKLKLD
jgi:diaminopimelate epimerase